MKYDCVQYLLRIEQESGREVFLSMLQEECSELIVAVNKFQRAVGIVNSPTPISVQEARSMIREEITDVQMMIDAVLYSYFGVEPDSEETRDEHLERVKWVRWLRRLSDGNTGS